MTNHFIYRYKMRTGLPKRTCLKFLSKAHLYGFKVEDTKIKNKLFKYLNNLIISDKYDMILYNRYIVVYDRIDNLAITLLTLPREYYSSLESLKKRRR